MKKILIIDDKARYPDLGPHAQCVDVHEQAEPDALNAADYATAFVHLKNRDEKEWAERHFDVLFVVTGGENDPSEFDGVHTLPRWIYEDKFPDFLKHYVDTGQVDDSFFHGGGSGRGVAPSGEDGTTVNPSGYISFVRDNADERALRFPIVQKESRIDFNVTLAPLRERQSVHPIAMLPSYHASGDGLQLLLRIRLSAKHAFSRFPIFIRFHDPLAEIAVLRPQLVAMLASKGVHPVKAFPEYKEVEFEAISEKAHLDILESLPIRPTGLIGAHDLANEWGPLRLWIGQNRLKPESDSPPGWVRQNAKHLRQLEHYAYLFALSVLRRDPNPEASPTPELQQVYQRWYSFLRNLIRNDDPLKVLLIDDEAHSGWLNALRSMFHVKIGEQVCDAARLEVEPKKNRFYFKKAERTLLSQKWDLVLCDLRLTEPDKNLTATVSRRDVSLSSVNLIRALKSKHPTVPVVAFTASNKVWMLKRLREEGIEGYWTKENPLFGVDDSYSTQNAADLLETIRSVVGKRQRHAFLWGLVEVLRDDEVREGIKKRFAQLGRHPEEVSRRLDAIEDLLVRAYGYLDYEPTEFEQDAFRHTPLEMAFIHVWGCFNEILLLRYKNAAEADCLMLPEEGEPVVYWYQHQRETKPADFALNLLSNGQYGEMRKSIQKKRKPQTSVHLTLLLLHAEQNELAEKFNVCREAIRNKLDFIHGDSDSRSNAPTAGSEDRVQLELQHIRDLIDIIWYTLLLDQISE